MKLYKLFLLGGLAFMAASCAEDIEPSIPQQNPQEPIVNADDVVTAKAGVLASDAVINLESYKASNQIPVLKLEKAEGLPEGAEVSFKLELSDTESFARSRTIDLTEGADNTYYASAEEWNDAQVYLLGKSPKEKTVYYRIPGYIDINGSDYRINSVDTYMAAGSVKETCFDMGFVIEDHYYLLSNATTWALDNAEEVEKYAFEHSQYDVYDDPVFVIKFKVAEDQLDDYWKIAPASALANCDWGAVIGTESDGDEALSGHLVSENAQAGKLTQAGTYKLTINMEEMTYKFDLLLQPEVLYTPGNSNGWNQLNSAYLQLKEGDYYYGVMPIDGGFKICAEPNWNNDTDYGSIDGTPANEGDLMVGGQAQNIQAEANGLYWMQVDFDHVSYEPTNYKLTPITKVGLIGSFAASAWENDVEMTSADNGITWTADVEFKADNKFKIRFNGGWEMNLGGAIGDLTFDGADINVEEEGTYTITFTTQPGVPHLTMTKK